jgi:protein-tyrosine-phosphatase
LPGREDPSLETRSTLPLSPLWPNGGSISPVSSPNPWTDETVRAADVVITMGCGDACPIFPGKRYESWDHLDDPAGLDISTIRLIRDDIERRVRLLIDELALISTG